ncbi:MAG: family 78 glycoside hydrolase catalytic domain, partial [Tepidisphaeraceae bacterium]
DWKARWINDGKSNPQKDEDLYKEDPAPQFRREFTLAKKISRARLFISGLGYYEASLNGQRVGDHVLDPGWTRYSQRVLYSTYDVTDQLRQGDNCLGVTLGNGWYNPLPLRMWGHLNLREHLPIGRPRFIAQLEVEFADGTADRIISDTSWKVGEGPIRFNSIYLGEIYDAGKETPGWDRPGFADAAWRQATDAAEPVGTLRSQSQPPIRATATINPVNLTEPTPSVYIFDLGQNFAGWARLNVAVAAGTKITLRYGELLNKDGTLNPMTSVCGQIKGTRKAKEAGAKEENVGGPGSPAIAWQSDTYIAAGGATASYTPRFTFRAFRYVEVTGYPGKPSPDMITGLRLNSDVARVGSFTCSNDQLNRIQEICDWTFLSNIFSVQSDCPHRERFGYGADLAVTSEAFMMNYDMEAFYAKATRDWGDSALADGMLTDTAPFVGIQYCGVAWAMVHPLLQRQLYQYYGNRQLIEEQYEATRRWLDLVAAQNPEFIIKDGLSDHEGLGDAPAPAMVTPLYAAAARTVGELADILGHNEEAAKYHRLSLDIAAAYRGKFLDPATGKVGPGTQASQAFALYLDLVPNKQRPAALKVLLDDIRGPLEQHLSTGIYGTKFMLDVLSREGHADLAWAIVSQKTFPGWGYMLENGATTLWEHWKGSDSTYSLNHPMFGSVSQWFYQWLGGIQPAPDAAGFDRIVIRPQLVKDLTWVKCTYNSVRGPIVSNWRREDDRLTMEIEIPGNATALIYVPSDHPEQITESGRLASGATGVEF